MKRRRQKLVNSSDLHKTSHSKLKQIYVSVTHVSFGLLAFVIRVGLFKGSVVESHVCFWSIEKKLITI